MESTDSRSSDSPYQAMDRMYRYQRYIYDISRKFYLLGRDRLLREIRINPGDRVLEAGCGTARNLIILAKRHPDAEFYGLDASETMLLTARSKIAAAEAENVRVAAALADDFTFDGTFGLSEPFDAIFFSYSISMIPTWRESLINALDNLKPGGSLYIVDFYDQAGLPRWFRRVLKGWLSLFHVKYPLELLPYLESLSSERKCHISVQELYGRYSLIVRFTLNS